MAKVAKGVVYIVGAGPGDVELLTLKAERILKQADTIFYDELVNNKILDIAPPTCEKIYVGKKAHVHSIPQEALQALIIDRVKRNKETVVRLKGGDPFIFGRGGEEVEDFVASGVPFEIVPGVTAGIAAPELYGIPLTHRGISSQVTFVSGHKRSTPEESWLNNSWTEGTLVIFMGLGNIDNLVRDLIQNGRPPSTPVAVVENSSMPSQRIVTGTLSNIGSNCTQAGMKSPATIVVGETVSLYHKLYNHPPDQFSATSSPPMKYGLIVLAHGSKIPDFAESVTRVVEQLKKTADFVSAAYLELCPPTLDDVVQKVIDAGIRNIVVVPYFLGPGKHIREDIPKLVERLAEKHKNVRLELTKSLEGHNALVLAVMSRAAEAREKFSHQPPLSQLPPQVSQLPPQVSQLSPQT